MRVLSHGQANVERRFSVNNSVLKINMSEKSIISRKLIIDHMKSHDLLHVNFEESSQVCSIFSSTLWRIQTSTRKIYIEQLKILCTQLCLDKEIKDVKSCISDNQKISENLNEEFLKLTDEAE